MRPTWLARRLPLVLSGVLSLVLLLAVILSVNVWRSARAHRAAAEAALQEYATFAAWTYRYRVEAHHYFVASHVFQAVGGLHPARPARDVNPVRIMAAIGDLARCHCAPPVSGRFAFRVDIGTGAVATAGGGVPRPAALARRLELVREYCKDFTGTVDWSVVVGDDDGEPWVIFYTLQRLPGETGGTIYGFEADLPSLRHAIYESIFRGGPLLPATRQADRAVNAGLAVRVVDSRGIVFFETATAPPSQYQGSVAILPRPFGNGLRAVVSLDPSTADELLIGGLPGSPLPLVVPLLLATAILVSIAGFFTWRTAQLARVREEFTSGISHELRTPLTQILLYAELLSLNRMRSLPERRGALDVIVRESRRLIHLVENVLQFSVSARRLSLATRLQPLAPVVEEVLAAFEPQLRARQVAIARAIDPGAAACADADALRQVLINFLDNATRYGPEAQTVTVGVERVNDGARVWVKDEGPGIPPADRDRIWQAFVRLPGTGTGGSGIGLAVVRQLVEMQGGRCGVEQGSEGGSVFFAELPGVRRSAAEAIA